MTKEELLIDEFKYGQCYVMAVALNEKLGWEIGCLFADIPHNGVDSGYWPHPVHAYVISPDGRFLDAGGLTDENSLTEEYLAHTRRKFTNPRFETFKDGDEFLTTLRHLEEGNFDGIPYDQETYSKFDYDYKWKYKDFFDSIYPRALAAIETLQLTDKTSEPSCSM